MEIGKLAKNKTAWIYAALIIAVVLLAFGIRAQPARFGELQALDPFYIYRMSEHLVNNNFQLPENDLMRNHPFGISPIQEGPPFAFYIPSVLFVLTGGFGMSLLNFAIIFPAIMGALAVLVMFFLGRELFRSSKIGLLSAFLLAVVPAFITRTSAGFFEKEGPAGLFSLLTIYFFVRAFRNKSWKDGIVSGISLFMLLESWGGARYFVAVLSVFCFVLLLMNRDVEGVTKAYLPTAIIGIGLSEFLFFRVGFASIGGTIALGTIAVIAVRYLAEKHRIVDDRNLKYVVPAIIIIGVIGIFVASMFSDFIYQRLWGVIQAVYFDPNVALSTVAESQPGSWGAIQGVTSAQFSAAYLPFLSFMAPYTAIWLVAILGMVLAAYMVYRYREWILILPLVWGIMSIWGATGFIRLVFLVGPPFALLSAFFLYTFFRKLYHIELRMDRYRKRIREGLNVGIITVIILIYVALFVTLNLANGVAYGQGMGPSICFPNSEILIDGQRCLDVDSEGNIRYAEGQPWYQAMTFLRTETPEDSNILSWWDFGYWFQTRGQRVTVGDGGHGGNRKEIALWFTSSSDEWEELLPWLRDKYGVTHILMDFTLPEKYGAISKIASEGQAQVGIIRESMTGERFEKDGLVMVELKSPPIWYPQINAQIYIVIWLPLDENDNLAGVPIYVIERVDTPGQYISEEAFVNDMCTANGIIHLADNSPSAGGCLSMTPYGIFYVPETAKNTMFTNVMFLDGSGLPLNKVFDNMLIKIYEIDYGSIAQE